MYLSENERHFVLVHGASHGAWCWYKVASLLRAAGHKVTTLDMAASGIDPRRADEVTAHSEYVEPLTRFMSGLLPRERVILVGHSAGGGCISVAMEQFPEKVSVAVYAAALMPGPGLTFATLTDEWRRQLGRSSSGEGYDKELSTTKKSGNEKSGYFKQLCPPEDVALAETLMRPYPRFVDRELFEKETTFTEEKFGKVARVYIMGEQDRSMSEEFQKWMIDLHPPDEFQRIDGADHSLMFSTPLQLFSCLQQISRNYYSFLRANTSQAEQFVKDGKIS